MHTLHLLIAFAVVAATLAAEAGAAEPGPIHSVTDIAHEFTFYFDGRFARNYLDAPGNSDTRNWGTLHEADLTHVNLLILPSGASACPYTKEDIQAVRAFLEAGGGVLVVGDHALFRTEKTYRLDALARAFGAAFLDQKAQEPLRGQAELKGRKITTYGGKTLRLARSTGWEVLICDKARRPVAARRQVGKGKIIVCSRAVVGRQPDAKDPINAEWWTPLLRDLASGKPVDPQHRPPAMPAENVVEREGLTIRYSDYMAPLANAIFGIYKKVRPEMERVFGVPPAEGMLASLILLPTGGGGFSSGRTIGLGTWWGGFPDKQYGMIELLGHEGTHSWVLPFPEPMWNEGIATYVGILVGRELGHRAEADASLANWLRGARKRDPKMTKFDLAHGKDVPHVVGMAKPMWIWEQLRKERPDILARYFRAKREFADPKKLAAYTAHDSVAVLSHAMGRDLFPWFRSLGITVDRAAAKVALPAQ